MLHIGSRERIEINARYDVGAIRYRREIAHYKVSAISSQLNTAPADRPTVPRVHLTTQLVRPEKLENSFVFRDSHWV